MPTTIQSSLCEALQDPEQPTSEQIEQMAAHWHLVLQWNARTNLTSITDAPTAALLHYKDSLQGLPLMSAGPVVDFGSGAGFPGIPLAIMRPQWAFTLVEPRQKRAAFLQTAVAALNLRHVSILCGRLEDRPDRTYACAVTRATFSDASRMQQASAWLQPGGALLAYRAADAQAPPADASVSVHPYQVGDRARRIDAWIFP